MVLSLVKDSSVFCEDAILGAFDAGLEEDELLPAFKRLEARVPSRDLCPVPSYPMATATRGVARHLE